MNQLQLYETLKGMPKDVLLKYAQNPTGTVPQYMAIAALEYQKELQNSKPTAAPQGTVKDKVVQEASGIAGIPQSAPAPQMERGVAALPVPETMFQEQSMAGGGIVAFEDGGDVKGYAGTDGQSLVTQPGSPLSRWWSGVLQGREEDIVRQNLINRITKKYGMAAGPLGGLMEQSDAERQQAKDIISRLPSMSLQELRVLDMQGPFAAADVQKKQSDFLEERKALTSVPVPFAAEAGPTDKKAPPAAPRGPGISSLVGGADSYQVAQYKPSFVPTEQAEQELAEAQKQAGTWDEFSGRQKEKREAAGIKDVYEQQFADIKSEKEKVAGDKEKAGWLSAMEAGLSMMAGTSPYAMQNIGAGALKGISSYKDALKEINQNEKDLRKENNALQRDQQNMLEARLRNDETAYQSALDRVTNRRDNIQRIQAQNTVIQNSADQYNATTSTDANKTAFIQGQENRRAQAQIAAHLEAARISSEGALYRAMIGAQLTPKDRADIEANFEKSYERYLNNAGEKPLTREAYRAIFMRNIGSGGGGYAGSGKLQAGPGGEFVYTPQQ